MIVKVCRCGLMGWPKHHLFMILLGEESSVAVVSLKGTGVKIGFLIVLPFLIKDSIIGNCSGRQLLKPFHLAAGG
jgi:flagellar assembly factor FliW